MQELIETIKNMKVLELVELKKALEEEFGVTAAAPVMSPGAAAAGVEEAAAPAAEEKTEFDVILKGAGATTIQVIKVVRQITGRGLKEAKELVDTSPKPIKEGIEKAEAEEIKSRIEEVGGTVELK